MGGLPTVAMAIAALALSACGDRFSTGGAGGSGGGGSGAATATGGGGGGGQGGNGAAGGGGSQPTVCRALDFDGIQKFVRVPDHADLDNISDITIEAWIKLNYHEHEVQVLSHHDHELNEGYVLLIYGADTSGDQHLAFRYQHVTTNHEVGYVTLTTDTWHHVAGTNDGTYLRIFIDGVEMGEAPIDSTKAKDHVGPLHIGAASYDENFYFSGVIDEVRVSRIARYLDTVPLPLRQLEVEDSHTVALWKFDEMDGDQQVLDATGTHHGTLGATSSFAIDDPKRIDVPCAP